MSTTKKLIHTPTTIKTKLNINIDMALKILEECLEDKTLTSDKRYKIASDYISLYLRMDNEKRKEEEHRESMRLKKLNSLQAEYKVSELEEQTSGYEDMNTGKFSTTVVR